MPETVENFGHALTDTTNPPMNGATSAGQAALISESQDQQPDTPISPTDSISSIPYPFESQSSLDEESGDSRKSIPCKRWTQPLKLGIERRRPIRAQIQEILRLSKRYPDGYESGRINQLIRSCRYNSLNLLVALMVALQ